MPVLESTDHMPRSALRHRPIQDDSDHFARISVLGRIRPIS